MKAIPRPAGRQSPSAAIETRDELEIGRPCEGVEGPHLDEPVAAVNDGARIAREGRRVARDRDEPRHAARGKGAGLRQRPRVGRIENDRIEARQILARERPRGEVAPLARDDAREARA